MPEFRKLDLYFNPIFKRFPIIPAPLCPLHLHGPIALFLFMVIFLGRLLRETLSYFAKNVLPFGKVTFLRTAPLRNKILSLGIF